ncbi:phosphatidylethanolamine-binding protein 4 isoform X2 [Syngnathoides biaculeatus]|uniref:phosphatidylethanolamine-binding protein 4 isoform X2 n=1 Tax=Syngnathoides biaculeatus TaxID=300417 RepID=UPI002ADD9652|nr:phosphatidylethanolamine-binding protein 4 isoform X2 [Syngnathoides biaculeatus]
MFRTRLRLGRCHMNNFITMSVLPLFLLLCGCMWGSHQVEASADTLSSVDASFCFGDLEVIYPQLDIGRCLIVPKDHMKLRQKLSTEWGAPIIRYSAANEGKMYVLVMVDPDAPSRSNPTSSYWRHWLVTNVPGSSLRNGVLQGLTITDYRPPTPPQASGLHRYQFLLYDQPSDMAVSLAQRESSARGQWNLEAFIKRFHLGEPVAAVQFLTQNYKD